MKKIKTLLSAILAAAGVVSALIGGLVLTQPPQKSLSGFCIGLGAAAFCLGVGKCIDTLLVSKTESAEMVRRKNIEVNDERNIRIREKVGAKINRIVLYVLSAMILVLGFMGADLLIILMPVGILVLELVLAVVLTNYYAKQM